MSIGGRPPVRLLAVSLGVSKKIGFDEPLAQLDKPRLDAVSMLNERGREVFASGVIAASCLRSSLLKGDVWKSASWHISMNVMVILFATEREPALACRPEPVDQFAFWEVLGIDVRLEQVGIGVANESARMRGACV